LSRLAEVLGRVVVEELEFRVAVPQRKPAKGAITAEIPADEADSISDPMFRHIYKSARRKATA
jgi:hypothetical protein